MTTMNFELKTPEHGRGNGTTITINGIAIEDVSNVELDIPADGVVLLKVEVLRRTNGKWFMVGKGENQRLASTTRCFRGSFTLSGQIEELAVLKDGD